MRCERSRRGCHVQGYDSLAPGNRQAHLVEGGARHRCDADAIKLDHLIGMDQAAEGRDAVAPAQLRPCRAHDEGRLPAAVGECPIEPPVALKPQRGPATECGLSGTKGDGIRNMSVYGIVIGEGGPDQPVRAGLVSRATHPRVSGARSDRRGGALAGCDAGGTVHARTLPHLRPSSIRLSTAPVSVTFLLHKRQFDSRNVTFTGGRGRGST